MAVDAPAVSSIPAAPARMRPTPHPLRVRSASYATLPVTDGFDWEDCLAGVEPGSFYLVVFRSVRRADADGELLTEFDDRAHAEARRAGGLLLYFKGEPDPNRACLSLCLWQTREQARAAIHLPRHRAAVGLASTMYESFHLERYAVDWTGAGPVGIDPRRRRKLLQIGSGSSRRRSRHVYSRGVCSTKRSRSSCPSRG